MTTSDDPRNQPMAEPGKRQSGSDVGGMSASADGGLGDAAQRSMERRDEDATGRAATGDGSAGGAVPRVDPGGKAAPAPAPSSRPSAGTATPDQGDDDEPWRHAPVAPKDENPLKSFGRSISDTVTGSSGDKPDKPKA
jgi:hypothetical protein